MQDSESQVADFSRRDEAIINIVTGMISTMQFTLSQYHPEHCKEMATAVVTQVRNWDSPEISEAPGSGMTAR